MRVHGHDAVDIFVRVERLGLELDHSDGDVRAVVGHTLTVGEQVVEGKAVVERALTGLQAVDVVQLHFVAEVIDQLLERLDAVGGVDVVVEEGGDRQLENAAYQVRSSA